MTRHRKSSEQIVEERNQRLAEQQRIADATKAIYSLLREHFDNPHEAHEALAALVEHRNGISLLWIPGHLERQIVGA